MSSDQRGSTIRERMMSWNNPVHGPRIDCTTNADTASLGWSGMNGLTYARSAVSWGKNVAASNSLRILMRSPRVWYRT
jgi:hypothetical protein